MKLSTGNDVERRMTMTERQQWMRHAETLREAHSLLAEAIAKLREYVLASDDTEAELYVLDPLRSIAGGYCPTGVPTLETLLDRAATQAEALEEESEEPIAAEWNVPALA
jgi:hypothetical protein